MIEYVTIATLGNALDFGDSLDAHQVSRGSASPQGLYIVWASQLIQMQLVMFKL